VVSALVLVLVCCVPVAATRRFAIGASCPFLLLLLRRLGWWRSLRWGC
jgi:hypothetical protein